MTSTKSQQEMTTTSPSESFGQRLRRLRKNKGLTQAELAELIGVYERRIRRWEINEGTPQIEEVRKLAEALGVRQHELLEPAAPAPKGWVLTINIAHEFNGEVIDMNKPIPSVASITTTPDGGLLTLGGSYQDWTDDECFKKLIADIRKFRKTVIQNGIAFGAIKA